MQPPAQDTTDDYFPFANRPSFECAELLYEKTLSLKGEIEHLLRIFHTKSILDGGNADENSMFHSHDHFLKTIDAIPVGDEEWSTFSLRYSGPVTPDSPKWKRQRFVVHTRNPLRVLENMAASPDFASTWHTRPYQEFDRNGTRQFSDLMSGHWAWKQAVCISSYAHRLSWLMCALG